MVILRSESLPLRSADDVVRVRQVVRTWATQMGFSLVEQTKLVTATSELARNTVTHGGGGLLRLEQVNGNDRHGLRLTFEDQGPGIPDVEQALRDGYTTGTGLGLGLGGARRLSDEFNIKSEPGQGTTVTIARWRGGH